MLHTRFTSAATTKPPLPVWKVLFDRQTALLHRRATPAFGAGIAALGLSREAPPDLGKLEQQLRQHSNWSLYPEATPLDCHDYFAALGARQLPVVTGLRAAADFDRKTEPDLFDDVFGRLPLLLEPEYAEFLAELGRLISAGAPAGRPGLLRFYRTTADFGTLAGPATDTKGAPPQVFGARLLTSARHLHAAVAAPAGEMRSWADLHRALDAQRTALAATASEAEPRLLALAA